MNKYIFGLFSDYTSLMNTCIIVIAVSPKVLTYQYFIATELRSTLISAKTLFAHVLYVYVHFHLVSLADVEEFVEV
jgi:hypothetical protein